MSLERTVTQSAGTPKQRETLALRAHVAREYSNPAFLEAQAATAKEQWRERYALARGDAGLTYAADEAYAEYTATIKNAIQEVFVDTYADLTLNERRRLTLHKWLKHEWQSPSVAFATTATTFTLLDNSDMAEALTKDGIAGISMIAGAALGLYLAIRSHQEKSPHAAAEREAQSVFHKSIAPKLDQAYELVQSELKR